MKNYLMTPGPVPVPGPAAFAEAKPMIGHRGSEFSGLFSRIEEKLAKLLRSSGRTVIFPASGTGALEALVANFMGPGVKAVSVSCGVFGDRFREMASLSGAEVVPVDVPMGEGVEPAIAAEAVRANPDASVLMLTQNETSTSVLNRIDEIIAALPGERRPLVLVDGVSSVGAMPCYPEEWGIDGLATSSQKGLLTPPGLGLVWLSERGWDAVSKRKCPSYYFDLMRQKKVLYKDLPENPYTPPVSLFFALDASLDIVSAPEWFETRARAARALAAGAVALGFELLVKNPRFRSPGLTAFSHPSADAAVISKALKAIGVNPAGGQGSLKGKIIRMAHYHDVNWPELSLALGSLYAALGSARENAGDFMKAAMREWEAR
jgi:aspartate aminotransferase-like enzyme